MSDLSNLDDVEGEELSEDQIRGILKQIDLDVVNLLRDGKLSALKYSVGGGQGRSMDRASNLKALLAARSHYEKMLQSLPGWQISQYAEGAD